MKFDNELKNEIMNKTPLQELIDKIGQLAQLDAVINPLGCVHELATKLLEKEKQMIVDAFNDGYVKGNSNTYNNASGEKYYNQTF